MTVPIIRFLGWTVWKHFVLISVLFVTACSEIPDTAKSPKLKRPELDLSTPDRALKSYWAQKDWGAAMTQLEIEPGEKRNISLVKKEMPKVTMGQVAEFYLALDDRQRTPLHREIISVTQETDSRTIALVRITNSTPIPSGVEPSTKELEQRKKGQEFRYLIEREGKEWKIAEVIRLSEGRQVS